MLHAWRPFLGLQGSQTVKKGHRRGLWVVALPSAALPLALTRSAAICGTIAIPSIATPIASIADTATAYGDGLRGRPGDPFWASRDPKRSKRVTAGVCG